MTPEEITQVLQNSLNLGPKEPKKKSKKHGKKKGVKSARFELDL